MTEHKRIESFDVLRGFAVMLIILFHSAVYNFANIHKLDFSNPPIVIVLISFMALWGGIFIIYSSVINTFLTAERFSEGQGIRIFRWLTIAGVIYLIMHYILIFFLGRWGLDFVNNQPDLTFIAASLRSFTFHLPHPAKLFEGSSLSTIAFNLILISWILYFLLRKGGIEKKTRNYFLLGISGLAIAVLSFLRIPLYSIYTTAVESGNFPLSILCSFLFANPYPVITYLSYGLLGSFAGLLIFDGRKDLLKKLVLPGGLVILVIGICGMMQYPKTISKPDHFWYFKTLFELGFFMIMIPGIYLLFENRKWLGERFSIFKWFSRVCLTIYMLETLVSEIAGLAASRIVPGWNQTINGCLIFGCLMIFIWMVVIYLWRKAGFKYSLEYFWIRLFEGLGKESSKMENIR